MPEIDRGWFQGKLGDFITLQRGFDLPEYERLSGTVPVVTSAGISGTHSEARVRGPGVVMGRYGTLGQIYYIEQDYWPHNTSLYVKDFKGNDPRFFYYFLRTVNYESHNDKSSVPGLNRNHLHLVAVTIPPLSTQRAIAGILGALDDKIELNRRQNATLEALARAVFQSWFVDFDPVRAKVAGRAPAAMDPATAALFPDGFDLIDGREVPRGWRRAPLKEFLRLKRGYDLPEARRESGYVPIVSSSGVSGTHSEAKVKGPGVVTGRYGTIGRVFFMENDFWPLNTTLYVEDFRQNEPRVAHYILSSIDFTKFTDKAAVPGINRNHVHEEMMVIPDLAAQRAFARFTEPLFKQTALNTAQNITMAALRDAQLPRLLAGELRVRAAAQIVEGAL